MGGILLLLGSADLMAFKWAFMVLVGPAFSTALVLALGLGVGGVGVWAADRMGKEIWMAGWLEGWRIHQW